MFQSIRQHSTGLVIIAVVVAFVFLVASWGRITRWFYRRYEELDFFHLYCERVFLRWQNILGGAALLIIAWSVWFYTGNPPVTITWIVLGSVLFLSSYYVWREYHIKLVPRLSLSNPRVIKTQARTMILLPDGTTTATPAPDRAFAQISVSCLTSVNIRNCTGKIVSVMKWDGTDWQDTDVDEPLELLWSVIDREECHLTFGVPRKLNLFFVEDASHMWIRIATNRMPFRMEEVYQGQTRRHF